MNKDYSIRQLIDQKALFVINHSGGKDSQAMYLHLTRELKIPFELIRVIHSHLGIMEWDGIKKHIRTTTDHTPIIVESKKSFFDMVRHRHNVRPDSPSFPSAKYRQCTSDLKRDPINKGIRKICNEEGYLIVVSCMGLRAEESAARAKKETWTVNKKQCTKSRQWFTWLPIHSWSVNDVFDCIERHHQKPFWIYQKGMRRCSCKVCIFSTPDDLKTVALLAPGFIEEIAELEKEVGNTIFMEANIMELLKGRNAQLELL